MLDNWFCCKYFATSKSNKSGFGWQK